MSKYIYIFLALITISITLKAQQQQDKYQWLEEVESKKSLEFVHKQNDITKKALESYKDYDKIYNKCLEIYNDKDKIVYPDVRNDLVYNFWKSKDHVRGIWRRTPKNLYLKGTPKWETMLDIDKMSAADDVKWVFKGVTGLYPDYNRFMVSLSKGGSDASIKREYDAKSKKFIKDGFYLEEAKSTVVYLDKDTLIISTDFGENTLSDAGYPNQVKIWKRGTPLKDAKLIFKGEKSDVRSYGTTMRDNNKQYTVVRRTITFYTGHTYIMVNDKLVKLDIPDDSSVQGVLNNQMILKLKSDWKMDKKTYEQGALLSLDMAKLLQGKHIIQQILLPSPLESISSVSKTKNHLLINLLNDIVGNLYIYTYNNKKWERKKVPAPSTGTISVVETSKLSDQYFFNYNNFLTPSTLYVGDAKNKSVKSIQSLKQYFDASKFEVKQKKVKSKDGTLIPYFIIYNKKIKYNGKNPTLLYGYGGFEISLQPYYAATISTSWLEKGGVYVLSNIRGGGEYGPKWHQAGLKEKRQNIYNDFHAVAENLIATKVTSPKHLGIMGGSNGGLLVGVAFTQRPDLYNAVVCQVPLLDMKRYNKLLAGSSWMGEFGNPDIPEEWEFLKKYSPYHNLKKDTKYPKVFFYTSTKDDRVHPGHARKMAAKMMDFGHPVFYYENTEGGHAGSSTYEQSARASAMIYSYLLTTIGK